MCRFSMTDSTTLISSLGSVQMSMIVALSVTTSPCFSLMNLNHLQCSPKTMMFVNGQMCSCCVPSVSSYDAPVHQLCEHIVMNRNGLHQMIHHVSWYKSHTSSNIHTPECRFAAESLCILPYHTLLAAYWLLLL